MEEDNKDAVMDTSADEETAAQLPANANETIYITNLNETVKLDGEWTLHFRSGDACMCDLTILSRYAPS
jgi:hypothetical protein